MRIFHFLSGTYGLKDIRERRLKISRIGDLNDPFELIAVELRDPSRRRAIDAWRTSLSNQYGLLCFSRSWRNPVQWAHYAEQHKGICLGFEVLDHLPRQVSYVSSRFNWSGQIDESFTTQLLFTKFAHWSYEDEYRMFARLEQHENGLYYADFSPELSLKQVIIGANSVITRSTLSAALGDLESSVEVVKARPAFRSFRVVKNRNESLWA